MFIAMKVTEIYFDEISDFIITFCFPYIVLLFSLVLSDMLIIVAVQSKACTVFYSLDTQLVGSDPTQGMDSLLVNNCMYQTARFTYLMIMLSHIRDSVTDNCGFYI
jgi:hypothetical protein